MVTRVGSGTDYSFNRQSIHVKNQLLVAVAGNSIAVASNYQVATASYRNTSDTQLANALAGAPLRWPRMTAGTRITRHGEYGYSGATLATMHADMETNFFTPLANANITPDLFWGHSLLENDIAAGTSFATIQDLIDGLVSDVRNRWSGVMLLLNTPRPSFDYNNAAKVLVYQQARDYILSLEDGVKIFAARLDGYENTASPGTPLSGYTDASVHPNGKGTMVNVRPQVAALKRMMKTWKSPYRSISSNMGLTGSVSVATTGVTGTGPTGMGVPAQTVATWVCTAEQPGLLASVTTALKAAEPPHDIAMPNFAFFLFSGIEQISPFLTVEIVSGAENLKLVELRPYVQDSTGGNALQKFMAIEGGDAEPDFVNGDVLTWVQPPLLAPNGSLTRLEVYFRPVMKLAGGTTTFRIKSQGLQVVKEFKLGPNQFLVTGINVNAIADTEIRGLPAKYRIVKFTPFDASVSLAGSAMQLGVFTGAGGTGTALVPAATLVELTAATKFKDMALAAGAGTDYQTTNPLYIRPTVVHGSAATISAILEVEQMVGKAT